MKSLGKDEERLIHSHHDEMSFSDAESFQSSDFSNDSSKSNEEFIMSMEAAAVTAIGNLKKGAASSSLMSLFSPKENSDDNVLWSPSRSNASPSSFDINPRGLERKLTERRSNGFLRRQLSHSEECHDEKTHLLPNASSPFSEKKRCNPSENGKMNNSLLCNKQQHHNHQKNSSYNVYTDKIKTTIVGSLTAVIFQIVYCLAMSSAVHRPFSKRPVLGQMVRLSAIGPLLGGPIFISLLGSTYPALYPMLDVFPAPFFVSMAAIVDEDLFLLGKAEDDILFLNTFCMLSSLALILTGILIVIGIKVKIANLASFLPYPVMSGFFTAIGFFCWTLAFSVDTGGKNAWSVLFSGDIKEIVACMTHNIGSVITGALLSIYGKRNMFLVLFLLTIPSILIYTAMFLTGVNLDEARENGWFWKESDFKVYDTVGTSVFFENLSRDQILDKWTCPLPFGLYLGILQGKIYYPSVVRGIPTVISMSIIYFIRCAVHVPALQKSAQGLAQWQQDRDEEIKKAMSSERKMLHSRSVSVYDESFDLVDVEDDRDIFEPSTVRPPSATVVDVLYNYGKILSFCGLANGFTVLPTLGASVALFKMGARDLAPQIGSMILLGIFYFTQFEIVGYMPKMTFSALLSQCAIEMISTFGVSSWKKTSVKTEWMVIPVIVVCSFIYGVLQSVALGLAMSTFIFVGNFYRSGVVKFVASGLTVHSTTERTQEDAEWLDLHGDLIQLLVLQSYIFFGNANSCLAYVESMFNESSDTLILPTPKPKYLIIDMSLVSSMDTSSVDVFSSIIKRCHREKCQIYISGLSSRLKHILKLSGVSPSCDKKTSPYSSLRYPPSLEAALSKAEDGILRTENLVEETERIRTMSRSRFNTGESGFLYALRQIDIQHGLGVESTLKMLEKYTEVIELKAGESLYHNPDGTPQDRSHVGGLYFIEYGQMRVERSTNQNTTRGSLASWGRNNDTVTTNLSSLASLSELNAHALHAEAKRFYNNHDFASEPERRTLRLARLKAGFVIGAVEGCCHSRNLGLHIAMSPMRLHFLSKSNIDNLEKQDPKLILELFKMIAFLSAKRQEATIDQLTTLHTIMSSLAPTKPAGRGSFGLL